MTRVILEITDVGEVITTTKEGKRTDFNTAYEWFKDKRLPMAKGRNGQLDHNWMVKTIKDDFNNKTIRSYVYGRLTEEYGSL